MATAAILDVQIYRYLTVNMVERVKMHHSAKFGEDRSDSAL